MKVCAWVLALLVTLSGVAYGHDVDSCAWNLRVVLSTRMWHGYMWADIPLWVYEEICLADWDDSSERDYILGLSVNEVEDWAREQRDE